MKELSVGQQKVLQELQDYFQYSVNSDMRKKWLYKYEENLRFYYGEHWTEIEEKEIRETGARPYVINRIEPIVNTYTSLQISARRRIALKTNTNLDSDIQTIEYLNHLIQSIQTQNDFQNKSTQKYTDALIGGLGWTHFGYEADSYETFFYDYVDPREIYWDPDDRSLRFEESNFVCRSYFVSKTKLQERYPDFTEYFDDMIDSQTTASSSLPNIYEYSNLDLEELWFTGRSARIVEVYYKKNVNFYETISYVKSSEIINGNKIDIEHERYFRSFDQKLTLEKAQGNEVKKLKGTQIWKGVYCNNMLLESGPLECQIPNQKSFPLVPLCLKRDAYNIPYGIVEGLIPLSSALNYVWSKTMHGLNNKYLIIEGDVTDKEKQRNAIIRKEMNRKDGIIFSKNPREVQMINSETMLPHLANTLQRIDIEFQQRTQLFDELKGDQTNAISGVAIQARASNSARGQNPLHATYEHMLFSEGRLMLETIKGIKDFKYVINYLHNNKVKAGIIKSDDINLINFEIIIDTAPNYISSNEEETARFEALLNNAQSGLILSSPKFLQTLGFTQNNAQALSETYLEIIGMKQTQEQKQQEQ